MLLSTETVDQRIDMMVPIDFPENHPFQIAFYCNGSMDQQQFFFPQLFTDDIPVNRSIPVTCWSIPLPEIYSAVQLNGHKPFFHSNDWATDLIGSLTQSEGFDPNHKRIIMIYADHEDLSLTAAAGNDFSIIATNLLATLNYLADVFNCHVVFTGMTVTSSDLADHSAHFLNFLQDLIQQKKATGELNKVHYIDAFTINYPFVVRSPEGVIQHRNVYRHVASRMPELMNFLLNNLDFSEDSTME
jgi:hypothetical protein